jgi:glycosyltransferase involved in cell wall biosynthesis
VAGQGPRKAALERQILGHGLNGRVRLLGLRRDRERLYAAMDAFVLPSRWEGLSLALAEAAGLGLPIVATNVGGNAEVVGGEPGVWLVPPLDTRSLATALAAAVESVLAARRLGIPARQDRQSVRERFSLARHLAQLETSYRRALGWPVLQLAGQERAPAPAVESGGAV